MEPTAFEASVIANKRVLSVSKSGKVSSWSVQSAESKSSQRTRHAFVFSRQQPGRNVSIVIESRNDDFVPGLPRAGDGTANGKCQAGHILTEADPSGDVR